MQQNYDINVLRKEAHTRWLKPAEVLFILQNYEKYEITAVSPQKPPSGSLFLFNRRVLRFFRKDGHSWRKKRDGRTVGEAHERLKVGNVEALNCYYAHGDQNPYFQRRSYWILDPAYEHIVLVHYREVSEGRYISLQTSNFSAETSAVNPSKSHSTSNSNASNPSYNSSYAEEVSSVQNPYTKDDTQPEFNKALRQLELQLSLEEVDDYIYLEENLPASAPMNANFHNFGDHSVEIQGKNSVDQSLVQGLQLGLETRGSPSWKDMFERTVPATIDMATTSNSLEKSMVPNSSQFTEESLQGWQNTNVVHTSDKHQIDDSELRRRLSATRRFLLGSDSIDSPSQNSDKPLTENQVLLRKFSSNEWMQDLTVNIDEGKNGNISSPSWFDDSRFIEPHHVLETGPTLAQRQLFSICEISPEWAFSSESTKVIIIGCFLCNSSDQPLAVMFGDVEVPVDIIQEGVLRCYTPPKLGPGKVTLCITSWNQESCSEVRDFELRDNQMPSAIPQIAPPAEDNTKTNEELSLLSKFAQLLLGKNAEESLFGGVDWIIEELLKEKLQRWLEMKMSFRDEETSCVLTKQEQGVIHWVSGLGYEWALSPILGVGVGINFRDSKGWTALHWAAYFGREKMVAALLAKGASATVVTDPTPQDPLGKTPGFLASMQGHTGLAAYLSEVALTTHLSSLTVEETEISRGSAELEAEQAVENIAKKTIQSRGATEDELSLKDSLAAVRNASQAAARIQAAFRAFSFRKRRENSILKEVEEYGMTQEDLNEISNASKMHMPYGPKHDRNKAALSIQKKFRGWKGRKNFLTVRQHVVKLQALVRGHQARKKYREFIWTVSIVEKAVLRWRRKGVGLRGFRPDPINPPQVPEAAVQEEEEEDIAKVFRKQKVDGAVEEAVSRVLSMVDSPGARQQYRRMIERYREAKAEMSKEEATSRERCDFEITEGDAFMY